MTFHYPRRARIKPATAAPSRLWLLHRNSCETVKRSEWHPPVFILILVFVSGHCADCQDCYLTSRPEWLTISACPQSTLNTQCDNIQITLQAELCSLSFFFLIFLSNLSFLSYHQICFFTFSFSNAPRDYGFPGQTVYHINNKKTQLHLSLSYYVPPLSFILFKSLTLRHR